MSLETEDESAGWGAPCEARPDTLIKIRTGQSWRAINAYVFGAWAVHRSAGVAGILPRPDPDSWAVTHVPSGCCIGLAIELEFWDAIRIARALEDTRILEEHDDVSVPYDDGLIFQAAIGAALHDHYVWPLTAYGAAP